MAQTSELFIVKINIGYALKSTFNVSINRYDVGELLRNIASNKNKQNDMIIYCTNGFQCDYQAGRDGIII